MVECRPDVARISIKALDDYVRFSLVRCLHELASRVSAELLISSDSP